MQIVRDSLPTRFLPRAYQPGELRINDTLYRTPVILSADALAEGPAIGAAAHLTAAHAEMLIALDPEIVLLGTGAEHDFAPHEFSVPFLEKRIGFESMGTAAACRTFSVLIAEQRRVVALLLP